MTVPAEQRETAKFLARLAGGPCKATQISAVFVGSDTVWKMKKAVTLPFLDFSSLDAREHFLRRELALNRPTAPGIYRDVAAIVRQADGSLALGDGDALEWVLRMAPVPADDFLEVIASNGTLTRTLLDALGDCVSAYHSRLTPVTHKDGVASFRRITEGNLQSALASGLDPDKVRAWHQAMTVKTEDCRDWLQQRSRAGYIRRCHGDLHLGNLCLWEGKPVPFDALEFDEDLATIDVAYDLAFLLMDLDHRVSRDAANRVMNRYFARSGELGLRGLPMFLSQRAIIRAHVLGGMNQDGDPYLTAAQRYLDHTACSVVAVGGLQGTGKSTIARALAVEMGPATGAVIVRSDAIRKQLAKVAPETRLGPEAYTGAANADVSTELVERTRVAAESGHSVLVDATFLDPALRKRIAATARQAGIPFLGIWLHAPLSVLEARVTSRESDVSDATVSVLRQAAQNDPGPGDWLAVDASDIEQATNLVRDVSRSLDQ